MNEMCKEIIERRSCKSYLTDPVPEELINEVVQAGLYAASGLNRQPAEILVITNKEIRDKFSNLNAKYDPKKRVDPYYDAPVILCVFAKKDEPMGIYDGSLALGNMMLAAKSLGLGSCWIHRAKEVLNDPEGKEILKSIGLTDEYEGVGNLALGYAKIMPENELPRREGRVHYIK